MTAIDPSLQLEPAKSWSKSSIDVTRFVGQTLCISLVVLLLLMLGQFGRVATDLSKLLSATTMPPRTSKPRSCFCIPIGLVLNKICGERSRLHAHAEENGICKEHMNCVIR